ncbi:MAG: flagellar basal body-associated protein FliL [Alphaproteobacteria bacterium]|nr:flagellar basal body-associated protein FliL [Alphaproteobacteria bacterium]
MAKKKDKAPADEAEVKDAPAEGAEGAEGEGAPKKSKKKLIIIVALVVLIAGGAGAFFALKGEKHEEEHVEEGQALGEDGKPVSQVTYYTMPQFLVNLNTSTKQSSFLKTTIILELNNMADIIMVEANLPRLTDAMNTYLRELRASDLAGSAGIQRLREELLLRANKSLTPVKVNNILFKEIVIQ